MKIAIVGGFFLPIPAVAGGATEKTWDILSRVFADADHRVTIYSRRWTHSIESSQDPRICYRQITGFKHSSSLIVNLWRDFIWSRRVYRQLADADIVIVNAIALPLWLGKLKPSAGRVVILTGRVPKGQYRLYNHISLVIAASKPVLDQVGAENPRLLPVGSVYGYPIDFNLLAGEERPKRQSHPDPAGAPLRIGFIGRIHREKGIEQVIDALIDLSQRTGLPKWSMTFCGPVDVARGGSGEDYLEGGVQRMRQVLSPEQIEIIPPVFTAEKLAEIYRSIDIFILPSLSENGETFGVAAIEAMAAGCAVITSRLRCFSDYLIPSQNGLNYDHRASNAPVLLADTIELLLTDEPLRERVAKEGQETAKAYDFNRFGNRMLKAFHQLLVN